MEVHEDDEEEEEEKHQEDVDLIQDSSPPLSLFRGRRRRRGDGDDEVMMMVEVKDEDESECESEDGDNDDDDDKDVRSRSPKRRRRDSSIAISSSEFDIKSSPPSPPSPQQQREQQQQESNMNEEEDTAAANTTIIPPVEGEDDVPEDGEDMDVDTNSLSSSSSSSSSPSSPLPLYHGHHRHGHHGHHSNEETATVQQQPTFHRAPRFRQQPDLFSNKNDGDDEGFSSAAAIVPAHHHRRDPLPDVFSPHHRRRGANRYAPGGLAAEVRDWLVDIEAGKSSNASKPGAGGGTGRGEWVAEIVVDDASAAPGMVLVSGRLRHQGMVAEVMGEGRAGGDVDTSTSTGDTKVVLAGPGRLVGLARRNEVTKGVLVGIARPVWEVELQGLGTWTVACDWVVLG